MWLCAGVMTGKYLQQRVVHFQGHVQGVGFRQTTYMLAQRFTVNGYVQNLSDGRVKLAMEGAAEEMDRLEEAIQDRLGSFIRERTVDTLPPSGDWTTFEIRY